MSNMWSSQLRYYDAFIQTDDQAQNYLNSSIEFLDYYKKESMLCTKNLNSQSSMPMDSGGPLLSYDIKNNKYVQIGITYWGLNNAYAANPNDGFNFYTRLNANYLVWIKNITNIGNNNAKITTLNNNVSANKNEQEFFNHWYNWLLVLVGIGSVLGVVIPPKLIKAKNKNKLENENIELANQSEQRNLMINNEPNENMSQENCLQHQFNATTINAIAIANQISSNQTTFSI